MNQTNERNQIPALRRELSPYHFFLQARKIP